jgi:hypothetical protein
MDPGHSPPEGASFIAILLLLIALWAMFPHASDHPDCGLRDGLHSWLHH